MITGIRDTLTSWMIQMVIVPAMEFLVVVSVFLLFGFLLYWLEKRTFSVLSTAFGFKAVVYTTGWLGTTAHELGHAAMCLLFGHRITDMRVFSPDLDSGVLGYVHHSYDPKNLYHQVGRLFIGVAPLFTGCALLVGLTFVFFPNYQIALVTPDYNHGVSDYLKVLGTPVLGTMRVIFSPRSFIGWEFWVFLYLAVCVASHLAPSPKDMEGFWRGLTVVFFFALPINGLAVVLGWDFTGNVIGFLWYVGVATGFLAIALFLSVLCFIVSYAVAATWWWMRHRQVLIPF